LMHRREPGNQGLPAQRVGRLFQQEFCRLVLPDDILFSQVSREHFQIWAEEWPSSGQSVPCSFFLTNYGTVGTVVDGTHLEVRGHQMPLHHGSTIGLLRKISDEAGTITNKVFLEFRFSLEGSALTDAEAPDENEAQSELTRSSVEGLVHSFAGATSVKAAKNETAVTRSLASDPPGSFGDVVHGGTSFVGADVESAFSLEVGGTGIRNGVSPEHRCILHGPSASACAAAPGCEVPCPTLCLGMGMQSGFWKRLLTDDVLKSFSNQHLQIEVEEDGEERRFYIRNLTDLPLRVENLGEDDNAGIRAPESDRRWQLQHGDSIHVISSKGSSVWMLFREMLSAPEGCPPVA